ncbi:hypothetical protein PWY87_05805 [Kribbella solani]|uniref:hypothetical protein n=1 Tax=Kribbella solani TaxID=236067 RepID=UPI0029BD710A|nr:hypothetical protein [Kribbella solani]MDX2967666.1 hypothetical protein [Kribbella solani]MDX3001176.1 hypothetical protein [Kribbella solani]
MPKNTAEREKWKTVALPRHIRPRVTLVAAIATIGLLVTACGNDGGKDGGNDGAGGVAAASPGSSESAKPGGGAEKNSPLAYSKCMRANGVTNFPDPDPNGGLKIDGDKVGLGTPAYEKAAATCKQYNAAPAPEAPADREAALAYAKCMRENGVPKFPDPNAEGGTDIDRGALGVDITGPVFKKADDKCKEVLRNGGKGAEDGAKNTQGG